MQELPSWMSNSAAGAVAFGHGRLKLLLIAIATMFLGFLVTSTFSSTDQYDITEYRGDFGFSGDILDGPDTYPGATHPPGGFKESDKLNDRIKSYHGEDGVAGQPVRRPSIKGALKDLHHAVSDKVSYWKTWGSELELDMELEANATSVHNATTSHKARPTSSPLKSEEFFEPEVEQWGHKTRIGKCTIVFGGSSIYERTVKTHAPHDRLHGYPLYVLRQSIMDDVWSKPAYILSLLLRELAKPQEERLEWLLWVDADTIMLNPYVPLEIFLPPSPQFDDVHLLVTNDWNGLNNGVFPVRVNQWAVELFSAIISSRYYKPDQDLTFRDQSAMNTLLKDKKFAAHTVDAPQRWFNAYQGEHNETLAPYQVRRGDFLVHFAGVINRDERILFWLDRAEQHLPDWEMEVQHTSYPAEVKDFWNQKASERAAKQAEVAEARRKANELLIQTEARMSEYQERLVQSDVTFIHNRVTALRQVLERGDSLELGSVESEIGLLEQSLKPLKDIMETANKLLMKEAHDAIFEAQKDVDGQDATFPEVATLEEKATNLKSLIVQPNWRKEDLNVLIEAVKQARTSLQQRLQEKAAQDQKLKAAKDKADEERRKQEEQKAKFRDT
ncbi:glycosyltransferase family 34 protein, partial [Aureobasidium melanogenum]